MQSTLAEDLSTLTTIPVATIDRLVQKIIWCICDNVESAILAEDNHIAIKMGFGTLKIELRDDDTVAYRFEPNKDLEESVNKTIQDGKSPLVKTAEESLVRMIVNTYKDFI